MATFFHVAPREARESIERDGLDPRHSRFSDDQGARHTWLYTDREDAARHQDWNQGDLYEVQTDAAWQEHTGWWITDQVIPATNIQRTP